MPPVRRPRGPTDPERATRIAEATFEVIRERGLAGLTHRAVAEEARVPLGSTTYHYSDRLQLIKAAMLMAITESEEQIAVWSEALDQGNVASRLAALLAEQSTPGLGRDRLLVEYELYLLAVREPELKPLSRRWDSILRDTLERCVGRRAGRVYFAAYNGFIIESLISDRRLDRAEMTRLLGAISFD